MSELGIQIFGFARAVLGGLSWVSPGFAATTFGAGEILGQNADASFTMRLFGGRDFVLGASMVVVPAVLPPEKARETLRVLVAMGVAVDALDVIAGLIGWTDLSSKTLTLVVGGAAVCVVLGEYFFYRLLPSSDENRKQK